MRTVTTLAELNDLAGAGELKGLFRVPSEVYHQGPGVSSTDIRELLKSPAHYKAHKAGAGKEDTPSLRFGRLVHMLLLEPQVFWETVAVRRPKPLEPERPAELAGVRRKSKGDCPIADWEATWKPAYEADLADWAKSGEGKEVITEYDMGLLREIESAVMASPFASNVLKGGDAEVSVYWTDKETGVLCKARADKLVGSVILDLKTCQSARAEDFRGSIQQYGYHISAAHYFDGFSTVRQISHFAWVALEKKAPYCAAFYAAGEDVLTAGRAEVRRALELFAACEKSGSWFGYAQEFVNISMGAF